MRFLNHTILLLVVSLLMLCCRGDKKKDADKKTTFKATQEWQTVQEGDILPSGLHYRMNLETGKKEAKLIDMNDNNNDDSGKKSALTYDETKQEVNIEDKIAESIRKINDENPSVRSLDPATESEIKQLIKDGKKKENEFRSYEELKSVFDEMNITVETDSDILNKLLATFTLPANSEVVDDINMESDVINYLKDFEYLVSQIDNARHFVSRNGITQIILPCLNSSNFEIKTEALKLLGSAVQNNIPVQITALEQNILQPILHLFDQHVISREHIKAAENRLPPYNSPSRTLRR
uniref:Nucleotide exchange factor SIL1 n=1 Tax=Cacopsylla melanoneura TaxID=428564 RepID=A0A8D8VTH4_9HEMI